MCFLTKRLFIKRVTLKLISHLVTDVQFDDDTRTTNGPRQRTRKRKLVSNKVPQTEDGSRLIEAVDMDTSIMPPENQSVLVWFQVVMDDFRSKLEVLAMWHVEHLATKIKKLPASAFS